MSKLLSLVDQRRKIISLVALRINLQYWNCLPYLISTEIRLRNTVAYKTKKLFQFPKLLHIKQNRSGIRVQLNGALTERGLTLFPNQVLVFMCLQDKSFENTVGKGEIARNEQFLLFPHCFLPICQTFCHFRQI